MNRMACGGRDVVSDSLVQAPASRFGPISSQLETRRHPFLGILRAMKLTSDSRWKGKCHSDLRWRVFGLCGADSVYVHGNPTFRESSVRLIETLGGYQRPFNYFTGHRRDGCL